MYSITSILKHPKKQSLSYLTQSSASACDPAWRAQRGALEAAVIDTGSLCEPDDDEGAFREILPIGAQRVRVRLPEGPELAT
jgi:hypothetical protein